MTISSSTRIAGPYTGTGLQAAFSFSFKVFQASDALVVLTDTSGNVTTQTLTSQYSVTLNANQNTSPGGTVTMVTPPPAGYTLVIGSQVPTLQPADLTNAGNFYPQVVNDALDRLTILLQQAQIGRAISVPEITGLPLLPPAAQRAGQLLGFDSNGNPALITAVAQTATAVALQLTSYISSVASAIGSSLVGFIAVLTGAVTRTTQAKLRETISVLDRGALGNCNGTSGNGNDDTAAIIAADAYLAANGGGVLVFPHTGLGGYRVTATVRPSSFVTWVFQENAAFPYNNGAQYGGLWADFSNVNQGWVVEANTKVSGSLVAYNTPLTTFPATPTYNCGLIGISIQCCTGATMPFGGIRMHGTAGAVIKAGSITGVGCAVLMNESQDYDIRFNSVTPYYGLIEWNECNATVANFYANQGTTLPTTIPAPYLMSFMSALSASLTAAPYHLSTNAFYNMPCGYIRGGTAVSVSCETGLTSQLWPIGEMLLNTRGVNIKRNYLEANTSQMQYGIVAALATFKIEGVHAFMSGTGAMFDIGAGIVGQVTLNGVNTYGSFGVVYADGFPEGSILQVSGFTAAQALYTGNYRGVQFMSDPGPFIAPTLGGTWANVGGAFMNAGYRKNPLSGNVELSGFLQSGATGTAAFTLPAGYRPLLQRAFIAFGSGSGSLPNVVVSNAGVVTPSYAGTGGTNICLDGITFKAEQ
jgi:hypothetical protein